MASSCKNPASHSALICQTASALASLFSPASQDSPAALLAAAPSQPRAVEALRILLDVLFPGKISAENVDLQSLPVFLLRRLGDAWDILLPAIRSAIPYRHLGEAARVEGAPPLPSPDAIDAEALRILSAFFERIPDIRSLVSLDVRAAYEGDPAALSFAEVVLAYPGLLAAAAHRLAHELYRLRVPILPRIMSEHIHTLTGADIHPGASIGPSFFIDHATGVVIGETAQIGARVKIYQGVTLGAKSFDLDPQGHPVKHIKRHPTVEDDVVIYANAAILGGQTVIGARSTIGANVFLMQSVPPDSLVSSPPPALDIRTKSAPSA